MEHVEIARRQQYVQCGTTATLAYKKGKEEGCTRGRAEAIPVSAYPLANVYPKRTVDGVIADMLKPNTAVPVKARVREGANKKKSTHAN